MTPHLLHPENVLQVDFVGRGWAGEFAFGVGDDVVNRGKKRYRIEKGLDFVKGNPKTCLPAGPPR